MKNHKSSKRFRVILLILIAAATAFVFIHSSMPADVSGEESEGVLKFIKNLFKFFGIDVALTDHIVRKAAHFIEFSVLGALLMSCAYSYNKTRPLKYCSQILFFGLAIPVADEAIQLNVEGRSGQITDVLLDFSGVIFGALVMFIVFAVYRRIRKIV